MSTEQKIACPLGLTGRTICVSGPRHFGTLIQRGR